jgi:hypothetical protein
MAISPCRTYLDTGADLKGCSRRSTTLSLLDELLGDLGLALQPGQPQGPVHPRHRLSPLESSASQQSPRGWRLPSGPQRPGWQQVQPVAQLGVGQVGVGATTTGPMREAAWAHQHGNDALDPGERAVGTAAEPAALQHASPNEANTRSS